MTELYKTTLVLLLTIFTTCAPMQAQTIWGRGLILQESIPTYADNDLSKIPLYEKEDGVNEIDSIYFFGCDYEFACIEVQCLNPYILVMSETEKFVCVFVESTKTKAWFRKDDLKRIGWRFVYYIDILNPKTDTVNYSPGCYALEPLNLREGPGTDFPTICRLSPLVKEENKTVFEIISLGIRSDNWLKVRVHQYDQWGCLDTMPETLLLKTFEGWIKAVDDKTGAPNVWFDFCCELL